MPVAFGARHGRPFGSSHCAEWMASCLVAGLAPALAIDT
jgi:hypothetical protein